MNSLIRVPENKKKDAQQKNYHASKKINRCGWVFDESLMHVKPVKNWSGNVRASSLICVLALYGRKVTGLIWIRFVFFSVAW